MSSPVTLCTAAHLGPLSRVLDAYSIQIGRIEDSVKIPGSYWGESEAGLIGNTLFVRNDTPLHSALHEACHFICMDESRRSVLHTDAGGDVPEENAVCFLQALLADRIPDYSRNSLFADMDTWGYSFRLGSARAWFEQDAADARDWLHTHGIIDGAQQPTGRLRR